MLQLTDIGFEFEDKVLLQKVSFTLHSGALLHLQGRNGAGKTTLLKIIAGLYKPSEGALCYKGVSVYKNLSFYQKKLCFIGHQLGINPYLTIRENCFFDLNYDKDRIFLESLAAVFNLQSLWHATCDTLSAGQKRQVALLRLWLSNTQIWLLDEPFVALDEQSVETLMAKIQSFRSKGGIVILSSHQKVLQGGDYQEYSL